MRRFLVCSGWAVLLSTQVQAQPQPQSLPRAQGDLTQASMFTLQVPPGWHIRTNTPRELVMAGDRRAGSTPMPMLLVQFCSNEKNAAAEGLIPCIADCDATMHEMIANLGKKMHIEPMQRAEKAGAVIEYRTMAPDSPEKNDMTGIALSCSARGQAFLTLVSDDAQNAGQLFDGILHSLKWNPPGKTSTSSSSKARTSKKH